MKTIKSKTKYQTTDGRTFTDATAAAFWEKLSTAKKAYADAKEELGKLLAGSFKTADGEEFRVGGAGNYYYVFEPCNAMPTILEVQFWWNHWDFDAERDNDTRMVLYAFQDGWGHARIKDPVEYPIDELYADRREAEKALIEAKRRFVRDVTRDIEHWEAKQR